MVTNHILRVAVFAIVWEHAVRGSSAEEADEDTMLPPDAPWPAMLPNDILAADASSFALEIHRHDARREAVRTAEAIAENPNVPLPPEEMKRDAQQMTTDFQLARIKLLEGHPKAAARYTALGQALQKTVWAPNLAAHQGGTPPPTPIVPTPCSALDPGCFFGMTKPGSTPPPAPTDSELKIAALGLGVKGPALARGRLLQNAKATSSGIELWRFWRVIN
jgi:hypothetical protein